MKLNWFSPVSSPSSRAACHTAAVLPSLAKHATVALWVHETSWPSDLDQHAHVYHYRPDRIPWAEINAADCTVYHLGNDPEIHGPIWDVSRQHPGIVMLHDLISPQHDALIRAALENATGATVETPAAYSLVISSATLPVALLPLYAPSDAADLQTADEYVNRLLGLVKATLEPQGREPVRWMASRAGRAMRPWFSEAGTGVLVTRVAQTIKDLFDDLSPS